MSLSNNDKTYWVKELTRILYAKILETTTKHGYTDIINEMKDLTKRDLISKLDLQEKFEKVETLRKASKEAYELHNKLDQEVNGIYGEIRDALKPYYVPQSEEGTGYHSFPNCEQMLTCIVEKRYISVMKDEAEAIGDDYLKEIVGYLQAIESLERTIMLSTSSTQMAVFIRKFADKFGIKLDSII